MLGTKQQFDPLPKARSIFHELVYLNKSCCIPHPAFAVVVMVEGTEVAILARKASTSCSHARRANMIFDSQRELTWSLTSLLISPYGTSFIAHSI